MKSFTTKLWLALCLACGAMANAQTREGNILLPVVQPAHNSNCRVFGTWEPSPQFLANNPDFLKDGTYQMSDKYINRGHKKRHNLKYIDIPDPSRFSSADYPAVFVPSAKKIDVPGNVYVQAGRSNYYPAGLLKGKKHKAQRRAYNELNSYYKEQAKALATEKFISPVYISDIGLATTGPAAYSRNDLYFQFEYIEPQSVNDHFVAPDIVWYSSTPFFFLRYLPWNIALMVTKKNSSDVYPSNLLVKLHVKDINGAAIQTYSQAVFVKEKHLVAPKQMWNKHHLATTRLLLKQALPVAMESLLNRFAEDTATTRWINERNKTTGDIAANNPEYYKLKKAVDILNDSERYLVRSLEDVHHKLFLQETHNRIGVADGLNNANFDNAGLLGTVVFITGVLVADVTVNAVSSAVTNKHIALLTKQEFEIEFNLTRIRNQRDEIEDELERLSKR